MFGVIQWKRHVTTMQILQFIIDLSIVYYASTQLFIHRASSGCFPPPGLPSYPIRSVALRYGTYLRGCLTDHEPVCPHPKQATTPTSHPSCPRPPTVEVVKTLRCSGVGSSARIWFCSSISSSRRTSLNAPLPLEGRIE